MATDERERTDKCPLKCEQNSWIPSLSLCLSLKRDSRVVKVLEMKEGRSQRIRRIFYEDTIRACCGEPRAAEPIHDQIPRGEIIIRRLDRRESEAVGGKGDSDWRGGRQRREGYNRGSPGGKGTL